MDTDSLDSGTICEIVVPLVKGVIEEYSSNKISSGAKINELLRESILVESVKSVSLAFPIDLLFYALIAFPYTVFRL
jgi:hypothetical protein